MRLTHNTKEESPALVHSLCWVVKGRNGEKIQRVHDAPVGWAVITKQSAVLLAPHGDSRLWPAGPEQREALVSFSLSMCTKTPCLTYRPSALRPCSCSLLSGGRRYPPPLGMKSPLSVFLQVHHIWLPAGMGDGRAFLLSRGIQFLFSPPTLNLAYLQQPTVSFLGHSSSRAPEILGQL